MQGAGRRFHGDPGAQGNVIEGCGQDSVALGLTITHLEYSQLEMLSIPGGRRSGRTRQSGRWRQQGQHRAGRSSSAMKVNDGRLCPGGVLSHAEVVDTPSSGLETICRGKSPLLAALEAVVVFDGIHDLARTVRSDCPLLGTRRARSNDCDWARSRRSLQDRKQVSAC